MIGTTVGLPGERVATVGGEVDHGDAHVQLAGVVRLNDANDSATGAVDERNLWTEVGGQHDFDGEQLVAWLSVVVVSALNVLMSSPLHARSSALQLILSTGEKEARRS